MALSLVAPFLSILASVLVHAGQCSGFVVKSSAEDCRARLHALHASAASSSSRDSSDSNEPDDDAPPSTPCVRICRYNANFFDGRICIGCYRDEYEISSWGSMSDQEKSWALLDAADRVPEGCAVRETAVGDIMSNDRSCDFSGAISKDELTRQAKYWENQ